MAILNDLGTAYRQLGENGKAIDYCERALTLSQQVADLRLEAQALYNLGEVYPYSGEVSKSPLYYRQALSLSRDLGDLRGQALALQGLGSAYRLLSEYPQALESFDQALDIWRTVDDRRGQALTLLGLGRAYTSMGENQKALNLYEQAKPLIKVIGDRYWEAGLFTGLGSVYDELGQKQKALEYWKQALRLDRAVGDREGEATDLWHIGRIYFSLGNKTRALACLQLALRAFSARTRQIGIAVALRDIGTVYESLGREREALECYKRALDLSQKSGFKREEAVTLNHIGHVYWKLGDERKALGYYQQALSLHRATMNSFGESITLYNLALLERNRGNLGEARSQIEAALKVVESLRGKVASYELRSSYFASEHARYDFYIDLLMQMHKRLAFDGIDAAALEASERARARSLAESLREARADIRQGVEPALLERERSLLQSLNAKLDRQMRPPSGKPDKQEAEALAKEIRDLTTAHEELQTQIRIKSPRYAALTQPQPLGLKEIQEQVLDDDSLLLEYALGDEHSYLWAVTRSTMHSYELPKSGEIERAARHLYELLVARQPRPGEPASQSQARVRQADTQYWPQAAALSQMLLGPVADQLGTKRLLIVAEGALQYVPFEGLPVPGKGDGTLGRGDAGKLPYAETRRGEDLAVPLMVEHEIVYLPSASVLAVLRDETRNRRAASRAVAVIADPVFEADDSRVAVKPEAVTARRGDRATADAGTQRPGDTVNPPLRVATTPSRPVPVSPPSAEVFDLQRALRDGRTLRQGGLGFPRLLFSRDEAQAIMAVAPEGAAMKATDFKANRATATSPELGQYRIVHFATHGLLDSEHPERSGLVLSLVDEQGQRQDGFLGLHDIYNLNLPVDLVVLSACNTALGKEVRGEGLVGIVRGFMYAGAARVIASLWTVDDEATAELMKRFYQRMLQDGMRPAAALRAAQVDIWRQKRWSSPFYWAAFTLQGEWK